MAIWEDITVSLSENHSDAPTVTPKPSGKLRFPALDGWRFWAALTVLLEHCCYIAYFSPKSTMGMLPIVSYLTMPFFFMLSGFLAAAGSDGRNWDFFATVDYYLRRLIRIWPQHFLALLAFLALGLPGKFSPVTFIANLLLVQSWIPKVEFFYSYNAPIWYLSTLLGLYLMMPLFVKYFKASLCLSVLWPVLLSFFVEGEDNTVGGFFYIMPLSNAFPFLCGMLVCRAVRGHCRPQERQSAATYRFWAWSAVELVLVAAMVWFACRPEVMQRLNAAMWRRFTSGLFLWVRSCQLLPFVAVFLTVFALGRGAVSRVISSRLFLALGRIGFVLYVWHWIWRDAIVKYDLFRHVPVPWRTTAFVATAIVLAFPLEYLINSPVTRFLNDLHRKHPFRWEFARRYAPLILCLGAIALYLGCVFPRPVDHAAYVLKTMTATCDKVLPVQAKVHEDGVLMIHPGASPTAVTFPLDGRIDRFSCEVETTHEKADVIVKFYLDYRPVKTVRVAGKGVKRKVSIPCANVRLLGIEVDKNGDLSYDTTLFRSMKFTRHTL